MQKVPKLRKKGEYFTARFDGKDFYFGKDENKAQVLYFQKLSEYVSHSGRDVTVEPYDATLQQISIAWLESVQQWVHATTFKSYQYGLEQFVGFLGDVKASRVTTSDVVRFRDRLAQTGISRSSVKRKLNVVKAAFRLAAEKLLVSPEVAARVGVVQNLKPYRSAAREPEKVYPVPVEHVEKILPFLPPMVGDMVQIQMHAGMRPQEICKMRKCEIRRTGTVWLYVMEAHKTAKVTGEEAVRYLGPRCQVLLGKYLDTVDDTDYVFSPLRSEQARKAVMRQKRKTRVQPSQFCRAKLNARKPGDHYLASSYNHAIRKACELAGVPRFRAYQLRHTAGTEARKLVSLDGVQAFLGHSNIRTTEIYAEKVSEKAIEIAEKWG